MTAGSSSSAKPLCLALACALLAGGGPVRGQENYTLDDLIDDGQAVLEEYASDDLLAALDELGEIDWEALGTRIAAALQSGSWEDLAALLPAAEDALAWLRSVPGGEPYAAWLEQRMDYLEWAGLIVVEEESRPPAPPAGPPSTPPPAAPPPPPKPPRAPVHRPAPDRKEWEKKLSRRPRPARADRLMPELKEVFRQEGVPAEWVWIAEVESSLNPNARSPAGAAGLFQLMPATAKRFGLRTHPRDERLVPAKSARAAAQYLKILHGKFGDWPLALAAYNAGEGRVQRLLDARGADAFDAIADDLPLETRMYVPKVMATVALRENVDPATLPPPAG
ncbi:MAG: lytic transglycosylase domain-containing protein [Kiritimatiellae bacterium]|nr:lytic transglycosylase domain-containing protein [Kiritimatiellia bacterium]